VKTTSAISLAAVLALSGLVSGCATDEMKKDIADAKAMAASADSKAQQALDAARASQRCCDESRERMDRAMKKAFNK
jgi:hypothetical protein